MKYFYLDSKDQSDGFAWLCPFATIFMHPSITDGHTDKTCNMLLYRLYLWFLFISLSIYRTKYTLYCVVMHSRAWAKFFTLVHLKTLQHPSCWRASHWLHDRWWYTIYIMLFYYAFPLFCLMLLHIMLHILHKHFECIYFFCNIKL